MIFFVFNHLLIYLSLYFSTLKNIVFKKCGGGGQSVNGKGRGYESEYLSMNVYLACVSPLCRGPSKAGHSAPGNGAFPRSNGIKIEIIIEIKLN